MYIYKYVDIYIPLKRGRVPLPGGGAGRSRKTVRRTMSRAMRRSRAMSHRGGGDGRGPSAARPLRAGVRPACMQRPRANEHWCVPQGRGGGHGTRSLLAGARVTACSAQACGGRSGGAPRGGG